MPTRVRSLLLIGFLLIAGPLPGHADTPFDVGYGVRIEAATATPARQGESSRIRFRILNDSNGVIHVVGIEVPMAREARLVARIGPGDYTTLESLGVPPGDTLDLTTSHLWYETGPVTRDLRAGETFDMTLNFVGGQLAFPVHVHGIPDQP